MTWKSVTQPLCRYCGKPIAKHTERLRFGSEHRMAGDDARRNVTPRSMAEAQRHVNGKIVSVQWSLKRKSSDWSHVDYDVTERDYIRAVTAWDGERAMLIPISATATHARRFAYAVARIESPFLRMPAYDAALQARKKT